MKAGAGKAHINLDGVLPFDGFDVELDSLWVRAVLVEAGERCCIVSVEATSLRSDVVEPLRTLAARETGCAPNLVWITVTHTFSSPHVRTPEHLASDGEREKNALLRARLEEAAHTAVRQALEALSEAELLVGNGATTCNVNRDVETPAGWWLGHNPQGYSDKRLQSICLRRIDTEEPIALLFTADVQSSVLDKARDAQGNKVVSGDLAGRVSTVAEKGLPGCVSLFLTGAAADQAPVRQAVAMQVDASGNVAQRDQGNGQELLDMLGERFAAELLDALAHATPVSCDVVSGGVCKVCLPGQQRGDFHSLHPQRTYMYAPASDEEVQLNILRWGDVVLVGTEPELSSSFGTQVRALAPHVVLATLVNGAKKYLPSSDAYDRVTYEAMNSSFGRGADTVLFQAISSAITNE